MTPEIIALLICGPILLWLHFAIKKIERDENAWNSTGYDDTEPME